MSVQPVSAPSAPSGQFGAHREEIKIVPKPSIEELRNVESALTETKQKLERALKEEDLKAQSANIFRLFDWGFVGPDDFKVTNELVLRQVAKKIVNVMLNQGFDLTHLFQYDSPILVDVAKRRNDFLNDDRTDNGEGIALIKWFEHLWNSRRALAAPGATIPSAIRPIGTYMNITVRERTFWCCCGVPTEWTVPFRSDLRAYDLRVMADRSKQFGTGRTMTGANEFKDVVISYMSYQGKYLKIAEPISGLIDGAVIDIEIRTHSWERYVPPTTTLAIHD